MEQRRRERGNGGRSPGDRTAEDPAGVDGAYEVVASGEQLARTLTAKGRTRPAAVIAWHPAMPQNKIDVAHIAREVGDLADVYYVENGPETFRFGDALPPGAHVYGNAARVYSADLDWMRDVYKSPLRMSQSPFAAAQAADRIIEDVLSRVTAPPPPAVSPKPLQMMDGTVRAFASAGSRAIVELADGRRCAIQREHVTPPVRLDWMLDPGQAVSGLYDPVSRTLDVSPAKTVLRLTDLYSSGDLVLALVEDVTCKAATLTLFPGSSWSVPVDRMSSNPLDTADSLVTEGEVVVVRFLRDKGAVVLSLIDVDDDEEVRAAPALLRGGTAWLQAGRHLLERAETAMGDASGTPTEAGLPGGPGLPAGAGERGMSGQSGPPAPTGGAAGTPAAALMSVQLSLATEKAEVGRLRELVKAGSIAGPELVRLEREVAALQEELELERRQAAASEAHLAGLAAKNAKQLEDLRTLRARNREMQQGLKRSRDDQAGAFETVEERVRHDIYLAWVRNVPAEDKSRFPLPPGFSMGPEFAASLYSRTEQGAVAKALKAVVEVLAGIAERSSAREVHPLRSNDGGDAPQIQREDGARCFRASIERGVASARRLHYWKAPEGGVELSRVVVHDDFKP